MIPTCFGDVTMVGVMLPILSPPPPQLRGPSDGKSYVATSDSFTLASLETIWVMPGVRQPHFIPPHFGDPEMARVTYLVFFHPCFGDPRDGRAYVANTSSPLWVPQDSRSVVIFDSSSLWGSLRWQGL